MYFIQPIPLKTLLSHVSIHVDCWCFFCQLVMNWKGRIKMLNKRLYKNLWVLACTSQASYSWEYIYTQIQCKIIKALGASPLFADAVDKKNLFADANFNANEVNCRSVWTENSYINKPYKWRWLDKLFIKSFLTGSL